MQVSNTVKKKIKVTHYLDETIHEMLIQLFTTSIKMKKKKDRSELISDAIFYLFTHEMHKLKNELTQLDYKSGACFGIPTSLDLSLSHITQSHTILKFNESKQLFNFLNQSKENDAKIETLKNLIEEFKKLLDEAQSKNERYKNNFTCNPFKQQIYSQ